VHTFSFDFEFMIVEYCIRPTELWISSISIGCKALVALQVRLFNRSETIARLFVPLPWFHGYLFGHVSSGLFGL
jgi:hypothetical protein